MLSIPNDYFDRAEPIEAPDDVRIGVEGITSIRRTVKDEGVVFQAGRNLPVLINDNITPVGFLSIDFFIEGLLAKTKQDSDAAYLLVETKNPPEQGLNKLTATMFRSRQELASPKRALIVALAVRFIQDLNNLDFANTADAMKKLQACENTKSQLALLIATQHQLESRVKEVLEEANLQVAS